MATVITAGNATNGLSLTSDNTGSLDIKTGTGAGTTALSISSSQIATFAAATSVVGILTAPNLLGQGQTYQNVTASRAIGTTYTNTTSRPIILNMRCNAGSQINYSAIVDGVTVNIVKHLASDAITAAVTSLVIPPNSTYSVTVSAGTALNLTWIELR